MIFFKYSSGHFVTLQGASFRPCITICADAPPDVGEREAIQHARIYAEDVLGVKWPEVRPLDREEERRLAEDLLRYRQNEPIQYITGKAAFYGLVLKVSPDVLIPRQETEELVHLVLQEHPEPYARVLDIGTGSGCIAIALQHHRPVWYVEAIDVSTAALEVAKANAVNHRVEITFRHMDILQEDPDTPVPFDMIVSNPRIFPRVNSLSPVSRFDHMNRDLPFGYLTRILCCFTGQLPIRVDRC